MLRSPRPTIAIIHPVNHNRFMALSETVFRGFIVGNAFISPSLRFILLAIPLGALILILPLLGGRNVGSVGGPESFWARASASPRVVALRHHFARPIAFMQ